MHNVAATDHNDFPTWYTEPIDFTDVAAPGGTGASQDPSRILTTTYYDEIYHLVFGTSVAAPHSTGLASLMLSVCPTLHNYDIEWIQKKTSKYMGENRDLYGYGSIDALAALQRLQEPYQIMTGDADEPVIHIEDVWTSWTSPPQPHHGTKRLAAGSYKVDMYKLKAHVTFPEPYQGEPWAWLSQTGYSGHTYGNNPAGYNYEYVVEEYNCYEGYCYEMTLTTFFYYFKYNSRGQTINRWVPWNPNLFPRAYTVIGIPGAPEPQPPTAPTGLQGTYNPRFENVELEWDRNPESQEVDFYQLDCAEEDGEFYVLGRRVWDPGSGDVVEYTHRELEPGVEYYRYRVRAHNDQGWGPFCNPTTVWIEDWLLMRGGAESAPEDLTLEPNYPNPFNPSTQIKFGLPAATHVRLQIMNIRGQTVRVLVDEEKPAGWFTVTWDGKNESGREVASGIYLYLIEADNKKILKRLTLIR